MRVLLVQPLFPVPPKSRNHHSSLPIGLLKIGSYLRQNGKQVRLVRGYPTEDAKTDLLKFSPNEVWVTSLYTYWSRYVTEAVGYYKDLFPLAEVVVGGIFASLLPEDKVKDITGCDRVHKGVIPEAEQLSPDFTLLGEDQVDYQILHASRGCSRMCQFCGTWRIEPHEWYASSVRDLVCRKKLVFYDNNLLANPHIGTVLNELIMLRAAKRVAWCESQSGFDGRILMEQPDLASLIRQAGFRYPRIAWDGCLADRSSVKLQLDLLTEVGYSLRRDVYVFMLYNWDISYEEMEAKRVACWEWGVQIADCRYRPLNQLHDSFNSRLTQGPGKYYIHSDVGWNDSSVKAFRRHVRQQNICVRHGFEFYSRALERRGSSAKGENLTCSTDTMTESMQPIDRWYPGHKRKSDKEDVQLTAR